MNETYYSLDYVSVSKDGIGTFTVSCPSETSLLSCGSQTMPNVDREVFRQVRPINSSTCLCHDDHGVTCIAWCTSLPVENFIIALITSKGIFQVYCPPGMFVLGCHISPDFNTRMTQLYRSTYPSSNGQSCTCYDYYGTDCIATCASNVFGYEVIKNSSTGNPISSCQKSGNVALGSGYRTLIQVGYDDVPYGQIQDKTTCSCHYSKTIDCYCICGTLHLT